MNSLRLTLASFLAYFALSGTLAPIGILAAPAALALNVSVAEMVRTLGLFSTGTLIGSVTALFLLGRVPLRRLVLGIYGIASACLSALLVFAVDLWLIGSASIVLGVCLGVGLAQAALVISRLYLEGRRASMLVATDASFSLAGFSLASLSVALLAREFSWTLSYVAVLFAVLTVMAIALVSDYPEEPENFNDEDVGRYSSAKIVGFWRTCPKAVWLLTAALFFYTLGQTSMLIWLPGFAQESLGLSSPSAGQLVGNYWFGMFIGQLLTVGIVLRVGVSKVVVAGALGCLLGALLLTWVDVPGISLLQIAIFWGVLNFGLLKCVISLASELFDVVPAILVSSMLLSASFGTALSPWLSSWFVEAGGKALGLGFGQLGLGCVLLLVCFAIFTKSRSIEETHG